MRVLRFCAMVGAMIWPHLVAIGLCCWLVVALVVGTIAGHGITLGAQGDAE